MVSSGYRLIYNLLGTAPFFMALGASQYGYMGFLIALGVSVVAVFAFCIWLNKLTSEHRKISIQPVSVVQRRNGVSVYFIAYLYPLLLSDKLTIWTISMLIAAIFFISIYSETEENNPIAMLLHYKFYEVTDATGLTYLVMSKENITRIKCINLVEGEKGATWNALQKSLCVIQFDESFFIHVSE